MLLVAAVAHLLALGAVMGLLLHDSEGIVNPTPDPGFSRPIGGDFVNMWTAGRMALDGRGPDTYVTERFNEAQQELVGAPIGHRVWAYPPPSLFLAAPFGAMGYLAALATWSALGLVVLAVGSRRFGFGSIETALVVLSPASLLCVYYGQTGNLAAGLLLTAMGARRASTCAGSAAVLSIKPQLGFALPVLWAVERRWRTIAAAAAAVVGVVGLSVAAFGAEAWRGYLGDTLPELSLLERHGFGKFEHMIPSMFMALRVLGVDGDLAARIHGIVAAPLAIGVVVAVVRTRTRVDQQRALALLGTALLTPYLHVYDLTIVAVAGLLLWTMMERRGPGALRLGAALAAVTAWLLPYLTAGFAAMRLPLSPLVMGALAVLVLRDGRGERSGAGSGPELDGAGAEVVGLGQDSVGVGQPLAHEPAGVAGVDHLLHLEPVQRSDGAAGRLDAGLDLGP